MPSIGRLAALFAIYIALTVSDVESIAARVRQQEGRVGARTAPPGNRLPASTTASSTLVSAFYLTLAQTASICARATHRARTRHSLAGPNERASDRTRLSRLPSTAILSRLSCFSNEPFAICLPIFGAAKAEGISAMLSMQTVLTGHLARHPIAELATIHSTVSVSDASIVAPWQLGNRMEITQRQALKLASYSSRSVTLSPGDCMQSIALPWCLDFRVPFATL